MELREKFLSTKKTKGITHVCINKIETNERNCARFYLIFDEKAKFGLFFYAFMFKKHKTVRKWIDLNLFSCTPKKGSAILNFRWNFFLFIFFNFVCATSVYHIWCGNMISRNIFCTTKIKFEEKFFLTKIIIFDQIVFLTKTEFLCRGWILWTLF